MLILSDNFSKKDSRAMFQPNDIEGNHAHRLSPTKREDPS